MDLAAGTRLGPYEIVAPIGRGGMGEVYRARDTNLNREVADGRWFAYQSNESGQSQVSFSPGAPARILSSPYYPGLSTRGYDLRAYDISPDGQRFLMIKENEPADHRTGVGSTITVVMNWFEELKARVPANR